MKRLRIAMFNVAETTRDPRVRRIAGSLAAQGHEVTVFGPQQESRVPQERVDNFVVQRLELPRCPTIREIRKIRGSFPVCHGILDACGLDSLRFAFESDISLPGFRFGCRAANKLLRMFPSLCRLMGPETAQAVARQGENAGLRVILGFNIQLGQHALSFKPDVVHCNDLDTLFAGLMVKERTGARLVYDAHEIYPEQFDDSTNSPAWKTFYSSLEQRLLLFTDLRLTVCDSLGEYFQRRYGAEPFVTVRNVPSRRLLAAPEVLQRRNRPRKILYHGGYFKHRGLEQVIQAAALVPNAQFVFRGIGGHEPMLRRLVTELQMDQRVRFMPPVTVNELIGAASDCDIGLNPFIPICKNTEYALPNKFFEYLSAGLAVASTDLVEMRRLTDRHRLGILFDAPAPEKIAQALQSLLGDEASLDEFRRNAFEAARTLFYWERESERLLEAYESRSAAAA